MKTLKNYIIEIVNDPSIDDSKKAIKMYKMFTTVLKEIDKIAEPMFTFGYLSEDRFVRVPVSNMLEHISYDESNDAVDIQKSTQEYSSTYREDVMLFARNINSLKENILGNNGKKNHEYSELKCFFDWMVVLSNDDDTDEITADRIMLTADSTIERLRRPGDYNKRVLPLAKRLRL